MGDIASQTSYQIELFKSLLTLIVTILALVPVWIIGNQLSSKWSILQKQKEIDLSILNDFYKLYGDFFSIMKLYRDKGYHEKYDPAMKKEIITRVIEGTYNTEGKMEAILVKITSEKKLNYTQLEILGRFRQAYQTLRQHVRKGEKIMWDGSESPEYLTFKRLSYLVIRIIQSNIQIRSSLWNCILPSEYESGLTLENQDALRIITSNYWENRWLIRDEGDWKNLCNFESSEIPSAVEKNISEIIAWFELMEKAKES